MGGSDVSSDYGDISSDDDEDSFGSEFDAMECMSPADQAEQERFGADYSGPTLEDREASRLLILMAHASTCPCQHKLQHHKDSCQSVKWMMLHVRDCPGTTPAFDVCPFPWCRKVKHLLYHLVSCQEPALCSICSPTDLGRNLVHLKSLNDHRLKKFRSALLSKMVSNTAKVSRAGKQNGEKQVQQSQPRASNIMSATAGRTTTSGDGVATHQLKGLAADAPAASVPKRAYTGALVRDGDLSTSDDISLSPLTPSSSVLQQKNELVVDHCSAVNALEGLPMQHPRATPEATLAMPKKDPSSDSTAECGHASDAIKQEEMEGISETGSKEGSANESPGRSVTGDELPIKVEEGDVLLPQFSEEENAEMEKLAEEMVAESTDEVLIVP
jgi:hypothetical protein